MRRNRAFTPRLPGDSATAERSARQHAHPTGVPPGQAMRFRCKADGFLTRIAILCVERQTRRALYGYTSSQDSDKDITRGT